VRYIKYLFLAVLAVILITLALANRDPVELQLLPQALTQLFGVQERATLPLFAVIFLGIGFGILIGFLWEWLREWKYRRAAETRRREANRLSRENAKLRAEAVNDGDDVIALIDQQTVR
jgi:uncharacterized integral membrane protein